MGVNILLTLNALDFTELNAGFHFVKHFWGTREFLQIFVR